MTREQEIQRLKDLIAQGDELEKHGYPTGIMNDINRKLLADLEGKA